MNSSHLTRHPQRGSFVVLFLVAVLLGSRFFSPEGHTQAPQAASTTDAQIAAMVAKLKAQQDQIVANQTKIEAQTAVLKEELREAKIYSARGGNGRR